MTKKKETEDLNPSFIISQAKPRNREQNNLSSQKKEEGNNSSDEEKPATPKSKTKPEMLESDYEALFIKESSVKTRNSKVVYIRKEFHDRILKITRVIGENDITLFSYLDNILEHHFLEFENDIKKLYKKKNTDVY